MEIMSMIVALAIIIAVAVWLFIAKQGDAEFEFKVKQRTQFILVEKTEKTAAFSCNVEFVNKGSQDGTIMDAYPRHLLPYEQFDGVEVSSRMELASAPRTDNYFEAVIIPKGTGGTVIITVTFTAKQGTIKDALQNLYDLSVDMPVDIVYQVVARTPWYIHKARIVMTCDEIMTAIKAECAAGQEG